MNKTRKVKENSILHAFGPGYEDPGIPPFPFYFEFSGKPYADGVFYGKSCKKALQKILAQDRINPMWGWRSLKKGEIRVICERAERIFEPYGDYREELRGMAHGADIPFDDLLLATLLPEACIAIGKIPADRPSGCTFCAYREHGVTIIGNNIDNPPRYTLMRIKRKGIFSYITIFYLGRTYGGLGMNEHGLTLAEVSIQPYPDWKKDVTAGKKRIFGKEGTCGFLENRRILESAKTVKEALDLLNEKDNLFRSTALLVADARGDLAIVSRTVGFQTVFRPKTKRIASPNICLDLAYLKQVLNMTFKEYMNWLNNNSIFNSIIQRLDVTRKFINRKGVEDMNSIWQLMRKRIPDGVCKKNTAITMVMNPRENTIFIAQGNSLIQPRYIFDLSADG